MTYKMNTAEFTALLNEIGYQFEDTNGWLVIREIPKNLDLKNKNYKDTDKTNWEFVKSQATTVIYDGVLVKWLLIGD